MPLGGAPLDLEAARQHTIGRQSARHAGLHHLPDRHQPGIDLGVAAPVVLVGAHHLRDGAAARLAPRQQLVTAVKRQRQDRRVRRDALLRRTVRRHVVADDEAATDRVIGPRQNPFAPVVGRRETQPVRVEGQRLRQEVQVLALVEGDPPPAQQAQRLFIADAFEPGRNGVDLDSCRLRSLQSEQHRLVTAVTFSRRSQRAVQLDVDVRDTIEQSIAVQPQSEEARRTHRTDRMRTRRSDTDLEEIKDTDGHGAGLPANRDAASLRPDSARGRGRYAKSRNSVQDRKPRQSARARREPALRQCAGETRKTHGTSQRARSRVLPRRNSFGAT